MPRKSTPKKSQTDTKKDERTRNWVFCVYPTKEYLDSINSQYDGADGYGTAPDNWRDIIEDYHIVWVESPLHDCDSKPTGELKKPHWHVLVMFETLKSYEQIKEITDKLNAPSPQKCHSPKGNVRYMAHLDNPDKFQYDTALIVPHGGADVGELLKPSVSNRHALVAEMSRFVRKNGIRYFDDLFFYALDERYDWYELLCDSSAYIVNMVIRSINERYRESLEKSKSKEKD